MLTSWTGQVGFDIFCVRDNFWRAELNADFVACMVDHYKALPRATDSLERTEFCGLYCVGMVKDNIQGVAMFLRKARSTQN